MVELELSASAELYARLNVWQPVVWCVLRPRGGAGAAAITRETLARAFALVSRRHPLLRARVVVSAASAAAARSAAVQLRVPEEVAPAAELPVAVAAQPLPSLAAAWACGVLAAMRADAVWESSFVWAASALPVAAAAEGGGATALVLRFNHAVMDGLAASVAVRDIVRALNSGCADGCIGPPLPLPPPLLRDVAPRPPHWDALFDAAADGVARAGAAGGAMRCVVASRRLSAEDTAHVVAAARRLGVSVNSLLYGAFVAAGGCTRLETTIPVSMRTPERADEVSLCFGPLSIAVDVVPGDAATNARRIHEAIHAGVAKMQGTVDSRADVEGTAELLRIFSRELPAAHVDNMALSAENPGLCGMILSNLGVLDKVFASVSEGCSEACWEVEDFVGCGGNNQAHGVPVLWCATLRGRLHLVMLAYDPPQREAVVLETFERMLLLLLQQQPQASPVQDFFQGAVSFIRSKIAGIMPQQRSGPSGVLSDFEALPDPAMELVLEQLSISDLLCLSATSRRMHSHPLLRKEMEMESPRHFRRVVVVEFWTSRHNYHEREVKTFPKNVPLTPQQLAGCGDLLAFNFYDSPQFGPGEMLAIARDKKGKGFLAFAVQQKGRTEKSSVRTASSKRVLPLLGTFFSKEEVKKLLAPQQSRSLQARLDALK